MRKFLLGLGFSAAFAVGCVAGASHFVVPKAQAAHDGAHWAYFCFNATTAEDIHEKANAAGAKGWEMVSAGAAPSGEVIWCFRKLRP